jgi:hypothetical protein
MPIDRMCRFIRSYQFGWFLGVIVEYVLRTSLGDDCGNGFEDAICANRIPEQSSIG